MQRIFSMCVILALTGLLVGCATSITSFQSGKTLKKGDFQFGAAYSEGRAKGKEPETGEYTDRVVLPLEIWLRYEVMDKLDLGFKSSFPNSYTLDGKYGLMNEEWLAPLSLAVGLGYTGGGLFD